MTIHDRARENAQVALDETYSAYIAEEIARAVDPVTAERNEARAEVTRLSRLLEETAGALTLTQGQLSAALARVAELEAQLPAPEPEPGPKPTRLPVFCSSDPEETGDDNFVDAYRSHIEGADTWATGLYTYWPGDISYFNAQWKALVAAYPDGIPVLGSPKGDPTTSAGRLALANFFNPMPQAWRAKFLCAHFQEPEENHTTDAARALFRARLAATADVVRPLGVRNSVHLQEWTINPLNDEPWRNTAHLFVQGVEKKIDYSSFSLYPGKGKSMKPGLDRIKAFSEQYLPGVPWGVTAAGSPVLGSDPIGGAARATRAQIVREAGEHVVALGGQAFGWFDFDEYKPGRDQLASKDPALRDALAYVASLTLP